MIDEQSTQPLVSVIMAAYNCQDFISKSIESVLAQDYPNFELIITNDNSTDKTIEVIESFDDPRIILLNNEKNKGAAFSRNRCIKNAKGKYLAILDADDLAHPSRFSVQVKFLEQNTETKVAASYVIEIDENEQPIRTVKFPTDYEQLKCSMFFVCSIVHSSAMIEKDFFIKNNLFYDETFPSSQDYEMWSRAIFKGQIVTIPKYLTYYRRSQNQMSIKNKEVQQSKADYIYLSLLRTAGFTGTNEELRLHKLLNTTLKLSKIEETKLVFKWVCSINEQNKELGIFNEQNLKNELILRFLRFCIYNKLAPSDTILKTIKLQIRLKLLLLPIISLRQRLSQTIGNYKSLNI